eukprot:gene6098-biopygen13502
MRTGARTSVERTRGRVGIDSGRTTYVAAMGPTL